MKCLRIHLIFHFISWDIMPVVCRFVPLLCLVNVFFAYTNYITELCRLSKGTTVKLFCVKMQGREAPSKVQRCGGQLNNLKL